MRDPSQQGDREKRRRPYPSDVSQRQWGLIARCLPEESSRGRRRSTDLREVVNAVNYRWTTGCAWRMLPHDFPPWETVYTYFRDWRRTGTLHDVRAVCPRRSKPTGDGRERRHSASSGSATLSPPTG